jgi:hypothetical protein
VVASVIVPFVDSVPISHRIAALAGYPATSTID